MATDPRKAALVAALALIACLGCAGSGSQSVAPPIGFLFTKHAAPLETNFEATPVGTKTGVARIHHLYDPILTGLPLVTWGDGSIDEAAHNGGISQVNYADYELLSVLGIYVQISVEVSGD